MQAGGKGERMKKLIDFAARTTEKSDLSIYGFFDFYKSDAVKLILSADAVAGMRRASGFKKNDRSAGEFVELIS